MRPTPDDLSSHICEKNDEEDGYACIPIDMWPDAEEVGFDKSDYGHLSVFLITLLEDEGESPSMTINIGLVLRQKIEFEYARGGLFKSVAGSGSGKPKVEHNWPDDRDLQRITIV